MDVGAYELLKLTRNAFELSMTIFMELTGGRRRDGRLFIKLINLGCCFAKDLTNTFITTIIQVHLWIPDRIYDLYSSSHPPVPPPPPPPRRSILLPLNT